MPKATDGPASEAVSDAPVVSAVEKKAPSTSARVKAAEQGSRGATGKVGPAGERGAKGKAGEPGDKGAVGKAGEPGDKGAVGKAGLPGEQGPLGRQGAPGLPGAPGERDEVGPMTFADLPSPVELLQELNKAMFDVSPQMLMDPRAQARYFSTLYSQMAKFQGRALLWALMSPDSPVEALTSPIAPLRAIA